MRDRNIRASKRQSVRESVKASKKGQEMAEKGKGLVFALTL